MAVEAEVKVKMKRTSRTGLRCALAALGLLTAAPASAGQAVGKPAADFSLPVLGSANQTRLSTLRGKVVLVDFWATWCEPCKKELPELEKLQQALAARGVVVLGVSIDKESANAQELTAQLKLTMKVLHDPEGKVAELYDPPKMPSSYVIDRDGVVRYINQGFTGAADVARLRQQLEKLSQPTTGSPPAP